MSKELYRCPGCGNEVIATEGQSWDIGCNNTEEHDDGEPLIMFSKGEWSDEDG